ncbi:hypothetical protein CTI12_AA093830 [Artemisia annua]|uniref:DUF4283 domain-containing protein n=1 Tax=Artemisia annua TaxID=35608 RepID=A0A2U1PXX4_ARTAN|nr:hypothetical protein CTI12_AA093830 [Artemisia annua]
MDRISTSYANMVKKDEFPKELLYIPTEVNEAGNEVVVFDEMLMKNFSERWRLTACGQFIGFNMHISELRYSIRRMWSKFGVTDISASKNGQYLFKFRDIDGLNSVIDQGPWMVRNKPLFVHRWSPDMGMQKIETKKLPVWVKMSNVPLEAWSLKGISALASSLGKPMVMDSMIASMCYKGVGSLDYARVLVEIDAEKEIKNEI